MKNKNKEEIEKSSINIFDILDKLDNKYENKDWSINEAIELAIEETSKAKDEEFIKILDELEGYAEDEHNPQLIKTLEEIKQRIKEE